MASSSERLNAIRARAAASVAYRNPGAWLARRRRLAEDREIARAVDWPRCVVIIGLPKSGSTWLTSLVSEVPGYAARTFVDPDGCTLEHNICDPVFESLPQDLLAVMKVHTRPAPASVAVIERHAPRAIVLHRDLRDVAVSRYFHVVADRTHRHHELYRSVSKEDGLLHSIEQVLDDFVPWVRGWRDVIARDGEGRYLELRYHELRAAPSRELARVLGHVGIPLPEPEVEAITDRVAAATRFSLSYRSLLGGSTARKGAVGDWRNHFTPAQAERFAAVAGDLLIELGYESDLSWVGAAAGSR